MSPTFLHSVPADIICLNYRKHGWRRDLRYHDFSFSGSQRQLRPFNARCMARGFRHCPVSCSLFSKINRFSSKNCTGHRFSSSSHS
jgi:hypothetical protein